MPMTRPLWWALALAGLSILALVARVLAMPQAGALLAASTAPGIMIALYEILRATDDPPDAETRRSVLLATALLAVPLAVLLSFAFRDVGAP
jgi:hypothetical protein